MNVDWLFSPTSSQAGSSTFQFNLSDSFASIPCSLSFVVIANNPPSKVVIPLPLEIDLFSLDPSVTFDLTSETTDLDGDLFSISALQVVTSGGFVSPAPSSLTFSGKSVTIDPVTVFHEATGQLRVTLTDSWGDSADFDFPLIIRNQPPSLSMIDLEFQGGFSNETLSFSHSDCDLNTEQTLFITTLILPPFVTYVSSDPWTWRAEPLSS